MTHVAIVSDQRVDTSRSFQVALRTTHTDARRLRNDARRHGTGIGPGVPPTSRPCDALLPSVAWVQEIELINGLRRRDTFAEQQLVAQHAPRIRRYFSAALRDDDDTDDCVQVTFARAFRSIATYQHSAPLTSWLFGIARHVLLDHRRETKCRARRTARFAAHSTTVIGDAWSSRDPFVAPLLFAALGQLSPNERATLLLFAAGFSHPEIGRALNVATGSSKALLHRARHRIRPLLGRELVETFQQPGEQSMSTTRAPTCAAGVPKPSCAIATC